jgi:methyl-accepting chemotaxis protein
MKLRAKLVWAGIGVVLIPMLLSAGMMWGLIQWQNTEDTKQRSGNLIDAIRQELDRQAMTSVNEMMLFAQDPTLFRNVMLLSQSEETDSDGTSSFYEFYKIEIGLSLANFARVNSYNVLMFFDNAHRLVAYIKFDDDHRVLGIVTQNSDETSIVKMTTQERVIMGNQDATPDDWVFLDPTEIVPIPVVSLEAITQPASAIEVFAGKVALKTAIPIQENQNASSSPMFGSLIGYRYISQAYITRLSEQTQADVNFFVGSDLYSGTLPDFSETPLSAIEKLRQLPAMTPDRPYLYTELVIEEHPYYQAYYPLVQGEDGVIQSTLVLSISKEPTYQKTRQAVILQSLVSILAVVIIIPVTFLLAGRLAKPIQTIAGISESIANGHIDQQLEPLRSEDEIGDLSRSFHAMVTYLRDMAAIAENISHGEITQEITPKTAQDMLGMAYYRMTQYFKTIAQVAERIQQGDLTRTIDAQSGHDVLGVTFNAMIHRLQEIVYQIRNRARELADASHNIATASKITSRNSMTQTESVEVTSSAMQEMASNISTIVQSLTTQSSSLGQVKSAAQHIAASGEHVVKEVDELSSLTQETASSIDQMGTSLEDIHRQVQSSVQVSQQVFAVAREGTEQVNYLTTEMHEINKQMGTASEAVLRLQNQSKKIGEILDVIQNVVDQTNLLALNASIIAAQAGTHGRAFAVVADEVKALANQTGQSVSEISQFIRAIQTELTETVDAIGTSANSVITGLSISEQTEQILKEIATGAEQSSQLITTTEQHVQQHTRASQHVQQAVANVMHKLQEISTLTKDQQAQSANITEETEQLTIISEEIQVATEQQSAVAHQIVSTMTEMSSTVQQNADHAKQLAELAGTLSSQARKFVELVEQFTVKNQTHKVEFEEM